MTQLIPYDASQDLVTAESLSSLLDISTASISEAIKENSAVKHTAREVSEKILAWATEHHLVDPLTVTAHSAPAEGPSDGTLFKGQGNTIHSLRSKQMVGVLFNESEKSVYILTKRKLSAAAMKAMPAWHANLSLKYICFGQAQTGGSTPPADGRSYSEVNDRYTCGSSIHPARYPGAGTIGCLVRDENGEMYGLTANHVSGLGNYADDGEKILAPGHNDIVPKGRDPFTIGVHFKALPMNHGSPTNVNIDENTDAAVFLIRNPDLVSSSQGGYYDTPSVAVEPLGGMQVEKVGRTTGYTTGRIIGISPVPQPISYTMASIGGNATVYFKNLLVVAGENGVPFSQGGDSGALVVGMSSDGTSAAIGIVIAGTNTGYSLILPIQPILEALSMTLVSNHNV